MIELPRPVTINIPRGQEEFGLAVCNDWHYGSPQCDESAVRKWVKAIEVYNWYWVSLGDLIENALTTTLGDVYNQLSAPQQQILDVIKILDPIKDQCVGMVGGNHEYRSFKTSGIAPDEIIAFHLGVPYSKYLHWMFFRLKDKSSSTNTIWKVLAHHTSGGGRTAGGKLTALKRMADPAPMMDLYLGGHAHANIEYEDRKIDMFHPGNRHDPGLRYITRHFSSCGSLLDYTGSYAEAKLMEPAAMCQVVHYLGKLISPRSRDKDNPKKWEKNYRRTAWKY